MPRVAVYNNPKVRSAFYQLALLAVFIWLAVEFVLNARANLDAQNIRFGFGFLSDPASFAVSQSLIPYSEQDTYARVFLVGLLNTLLVSVLGIVFATILGFVVGIARLSPNLLVARLAGGYVELVRNLPLLFQILFWYLAVLGTLPRPRESLSFLGAAYLNNRGVFLPSIVPGEGARWLVIAFVLGVVATGLVAIWAKRRKERTGREFPVALAGIGLIAGLPLIALLALGFPFGFGYPQLRGFNFVGGIRIVPEFIALLIALVTYTAAFIAEIVRAGLLAVPRGQTEAAEALGLRRGKVLRFVVVPQAMRVIVPPLTNQYLNLTKNSSLAVAIGYPDLFAVFAGTALNQTHQAIEIIAITMAVYLLISLVTSLAMNLYNARVQAKER
ncbi:MAG: amino acid ABC transporter permease [Xanthobacteraceae bacterium]